jgi:hypothetical protein
MICILMVEITTQKILMIKAKAVNNGCLFLCLVSKNLQNVTLHITQQLTQNLTLIALYLISYSIIYIIIIQYIISLYSRGIYLIIIVIYNIYKGRIYFKIYY